MRETFFDSHCHLMHPRFAGDLDAVMERSRAAGVTQLLFVGTDVESSQQAIHLAETHDGCYASVGIAPHEAGKVPLSSVEALADLARHPKVVAIGETGLEYHHARTSREVQQALLRRHLELARQVGLPLVFHHREADTDWRRILEEEGLPEAGGVMH
ncbi:MAG TPA: TatD family deoxyribonuclease, partial [Firmicutes bacterium]|nr:TatD family deoxyribonuclease [Bacillota bacterium]